MNGELMEAITAYQDISGLDDKQMDAKVVDFVLRQFGKNLARWEGKDTNPWDLRTLKDGEVILFTNRLGKQIQQLKNDQASI